MSARERESERARERESERGREMKRERKRERERERERERARERERESLIYSSSITNLLERQVRWGSSYVAAKQQQLTLYKRLADSHTEAHTQQSIPNPLPPPHTHQHEPGYPQCVGTHSAFFVCVGQVRVCVCIYIY